MGLVLLIASVTILATATGAWAPHVAQMTATPTEVEPGGEVTVEGPRGYGSEGTVEVHFGAVDGPVIGEFETDMQFFAAWSAGTVTIPEDAAPGTYVLYATQELTEANAHIRGIPARATVQVVGEGGAPVLGAPDNPLVDRPASLIAQEPVGTGPLVLLGLAGAVAGLLFAGFVVAAGARRRDTAVERVDA